MNKKTWDSLMILTVFMFVLMLGPLIFIWCINVLFHLNVGYGIIEWLAASIFLGLLLVVTWRPSGGKCR